MVNGKIIDLSPLIKVTGMKLRVSDLKMLVGMLSEAAVSPSQMKSQGLALLRKRNGAMSTYILYDPNVAYKVFEKAAKSTEDEPKIPSKLINSGKFILGTITTHKPEQPSNGATEIKMTAAVKGYGPYMYDIVMGMEGGLIPDRKSVSGLAKKVWSRYQKRVDVHHYKLDDYEHPKTPDPNDDAVVYPGGNENPLNYSYEIDRTPEAGELMARHEDLIDLLRKKIGYEEDTIDSVLVGAADNYFVNRYKDNFGGSFD